jgi:hypothetical protein
VKLWECLPHFEVLERLFSPSLALFLIDLFLERMFELVQEILAEINHVINTTFS